MRKIPTPASMPMPAPEKRATVKIVAAKTPTPKVAAKSAPKSAVKSAPKVAVKSAPKSAAKSAPPTPRVVAETPATYFAGVAGRAWRMSGKHAVAYVHTAALAGELLATEPRQVAGSAMAVYYDRKGRAFAWQFRFDTTRWAEVTGRLL